MWDRKVLIEHSPYLELWVVEFLCYSISVEKGDCSGGCDSDSTVSSGMFLEFKVSVGFPGNSCVGNY